MDEARSVGTATVPQYIPTEKLISLVPHRGKMFLLSRVTSYDVRKNSIVAEYDITESCILYDDELGGVPTWAGFEMMAQSISALCTIQQICSGGADSRACAISAGKTVVLKVCESYRADNVCRYDCQMYERGGDEPLADAAITVMGIEDMRSFFSSLE